MTRALITGCSTGIGRATAVELTKRGYEVVATARWPEVLDDLDVTARLALDVTSRESVENAVGAAGEVDVLVNNAGIGVGGPVEFVPLERAQAMFETNVWGPARMVQALAPGMRARNRGAIVNVTSLLGRAVGPLSGYYAASKWALEALTEAMYLELGHWGIKVIAIEPGYIATPMSEKDESYGADVPPNDELARIWQRQLQAVPGRSTGPRTCRGRDRRCPRTRRALALPPGRRARRDGGRRTQVDELRAVLRVDARAPGPRLVKATQPPATWSRSLCFRTDLLSECLEAFSLVVTHQVAQDYLASYCTPHTSHPPSDHTQHRTGSHSWRSSRPRQPSRSSSSVQPATVPSVNDQ